MIEPAVSKTMAVQLAIAALDDSNLVVGVVDHKSAKVLSEGTGSARDYGLYFVRFTSSDDPMIWKSSFLRAFVVNDKTGEVSEFFPM